MIKERVKTSVIVLLIINMLFVTTELWFVHNYASVGQNVENYIRTIPVVNLFFPVEEEYSVPKENLSQPRKFLINDGSLWTVYYNTDVGFFPIEQRTRSIIKGFLNGEITTRKEINNETWEAGLESLSIYVEYPISFSMDMFCKIMGVDSKNAPKEIKNVHEFVILPSSDENDVCLLIRDPDDKNISYAYILSSKYQFPAEDLKVYTTSTKERCEPAFSTGLLLDKNNPVSLSPLVLFSDSKPKNAVLNPYSLINDSSITKLLKNFSFNPVTANHYKSENGTENFIENYSSIKIYPDNIFEYTSVNESKGIILDESGNAYNTLNSAIDFAEKTWRCVSGEQFNVLVTSNLSDFDSLKPYTFKFNYYYNGCPIEVDIGDNYEHDKLLCSIEVTVVNGRLISYRQYMCSYNPVSDLRISDDFLTALDNFVITVDNSQNNPAVINDIYIGYFDTGSSKPLEARWLAKTEGSNKIYHYTAEVEEET